jgi:hypothetical protein
LASRIGADRASLSVSGRELAHLYRAQPSNFGANMGDPELADSDQGAANYRVMPPLSRLNAELRIIF